MRVAVLAAALFLAGATPANATDRTVDLLRALDACAPGDPESYAPKLGVLLALADGRSADELVGVLGRQRPCTGHISAYGEGREELVFVGGIGGRWPDGSGALLWVDRGWWRAASLPIGYIPGTGEVRHIGTSREFFVGLDSGGSGGTVGLLGIRLDGAVANVTLDFVPGAELGGQLLDDDHLLISGRRTTDRLFTWMTHPAWPWGAQWIFERRDGLWVETASHQSRDPQWLMTGFVGALRKGDTDAMRRFGTDEAVSQALSLPLDERAGFDGLQIDPKLTRNEQMTWSALPDALRRTPANGPVYGHFADYDAYSRMVWDVGMRFDREGDGWIITALWRLTPILGVTSLIP